MWQGMRVDADTMALGLAHEVGPRGNYLAQPHTARHCRDQLWPAPLAPEILTALNDIQTRFEGNYPPRETGLEQPCRS